MFKKNIRKVKLVQIEQHPYHVKINRTSDTSSLKCSLKRTGDEPINPIVVVPQKDDPEKYWLVSGNTRLDTLVENGKDETDVIVCDVTDETKIKNLIVDLNKQRVRDGFEKLWEFRHYLQMYPQNKGGKGSRYSLIGKELNLTFEKVKELVMLNNFFEGDGDIVLEKVFDGTLSVYQVKKFKKVFEMFPGKFNGDDVFEKISDPEFDFDRLEESVKYFSLDDEGEFEIVKKYLRKDLSKDDFQKILEQLGKVQLEINNHNTNKTSIPDITEDYMTENSHLIKSDNRKVFPYLNPEKKFRCIIGSPPYGGLRTNGDSENETGHNMTGEEYGLYLSETYEMYKPYLTEDGSIYVVIDDFESKGSFSCSTEHFVLEMVKKGFHLISRYKWIKKNPKPRSHKTKKIVNGFEMIYRFVLDPKNYYNNPDMFLETKEGLKLQTGCSNHSKDGKNTQGGYYIQSHLKKINNVLEHGLTEDIIRCNVLNPEDYFRQKDEIKHTSQYPPELCGVLILEGSEKGDEILDVWNGVGNTMVSSLLLGRKYTGIEIEKGYYDQTCRRTDTIEGYLKNDEVIEMFNSLKKVS